MSDRFEAAVTISYEAQARLRDPIYGCVSHIFALQQQIVSLQEEVASLKEQAAQGLLNGSNTSNSTEKSYGTRPPNPQNLRTYYQLGNTNTAPQFDPNLAESIYCLNELLGQSPIIQTNAVVQEESCSFTFFGEASHSIGGSLNNQTESKRWASRDAEELGSVAFGNI